MDRELTELDIERDQEEIIKSFPVLFRDMRWIAVGLGWYGIIYDLCAKLNTIIKEDYEDSLLEEYPAFTDFKEKFGSLRIGITYANDRIMDAVDECEKLSETHCEVCGRESKIEKIRGWLFNRCERCKDG